MSFLKRAIRNGIRNGISDAVESAVKKAVEPKATEWANKTAQQLDSHGQNKSQSNPVTPSSLESAFANLQRAAEGYATEMSKNIKICPACEEVSSADKTFCPHCGAKLPEVSLAEGGVCPSCGKQSAIGTKFCDACGTKLPAAIAAETAAQQKMDEALLAWEQILPMFPKWRCGGTELFVESHDPAECSGYFASVSIGFPKGTSGEPALKQYWEILQSEGFRMAGRYPDAQKLYKKVGDTCYLASAEHAFDGGMEDLCLEFAVREPDGGFDYVKPEEKPQPTWKDLAGQLGDKKELGDLKDGLKDLKNIFRR